MSAGHFLENADPAQPECLEQATFALPWAGRLFGVTVAAIERDVFTRAEFQGALIAAIRRHEAGGGAVVDEADYYERWGEALVALLGDKTALNAERLAAAEAAVRCAVPDHDHDHDTPPRARPITRDPDREVVP